MMTVCCCVRTVPLREVHVCVCVSIPVLDMLTRNVFHFKEVAVLLLIYR